MTKLNVTPEAGRLLDYVGRVALVIRFCARNPAL